MTAQEAVRAAKSYVLEMFAEEGVSNLGLEELEFDDDDNTWRVTVGFSRPWNKQSNPFVATIASGGEIAQRSYKTVRINGQSAQVLSIRNREVAV